MMMKIMIFTVIAMVSIAPVWRVKATSQTWGKAMTKDRFDIHQPITNQIITSSEQASRSISIDLDDGAQ